MPCHSNERTILELNHKSRLGKLALHVSVIYFWHVQICLEPDEYLTGMKGHVGEFGGSFLVGALTLVGNRRSFGPYGTRKGPPFELPAVGGRIVGFHGRSGGLIDALGIYVETDN